jgi:hypothetical protein
MWPRAGDDVARQVLQFGAREPVAEAEVRREKRQGDFHFRFRGQFDFGLFGRFADAGEDG